MELVSIEDLVKAGVHFGHRTKRWNPKMEKYIFGKRNGVHIIDLRQTMETIKQRIVERTDQNSILILNMYLEGFKQVEIAQKLGMSSKTVYRRIKIIRYELMQLLNAQTS